MNGPAHVAAGVLAAVGVAAVAGATLAGAAAAALGGLASAKLPDVDRGADATYNHRSVTHSAALAVPVLVVGGSLLPYEALPAALAGPARLWVAGFVASYASHLVLDAVTIRRIPLFSSVARALACRWSTLTRSAAGWCRPPSCGALGHWLWC